MHKLHNPSQTQIKAKLKALAETQQSQIDEKNQNPNKKQSTQ